jgi:hypothetical protein
MIYSQPQPAALHEFSEYPKMVYPKSEDGKTPTYNGRGQAEDGIIVNDEAEEAAVMATSKPPVREDEEIARLQKVCETKGVKYDRRWGVKKLTSAVEDAGFDPALDPDA